MSWTKRKKCAVTALQTCRDWRGIKHHLSQFSTDELLHLLDTAQQTSEQIGRFIHLLNKELALRKNVGADTPSA
jgi:hypothetical protein